MINNLRTLVVFSSVSIQCNFACLSFMLTLYYNNLLSAWSCLLTEWRKELVEWILRFYNFELTISNLWGWCFRQLKRIINNINIFSLSTRSMQNKFSITSPLSSIQGILFFWQRKKKTLRIRQSFHDYKMFLENFKACPFN